MHRDQFTSVFFAALLAAQPTWAAPTTDSGAINKDPFAAVEHIVLPNGLNVYLAQSHSAKLTDVRLEVAVGTEVETGSTVGVSHLLEHVLFRDKQLVDEMSYLQLIKEAGGSANGSTEFRKTSFYASIPYAKSSWLLDIFGKMLLEPVIRPEYVEKEKATVELERGRTGPLDELLQFDISRITNPTYLRSPDFWESEFQIQLKEGYTLGEERLATKRLTADVVKKHYDDYYYAANMKLYITGHFDRAYVDKVIKEKWATLPTRSGKTLPAWPVAKFRKEPYTRTVITNDTPYIYLGAKLEKVELKEALVAGSYVQYLAHRLMKDIRNRKGQTYSANGSMETFNRNGYAVVQFQTQPEHFEENLKTAKDYIRSETQTTGLTKEQVEESIRLFADQYELSGQESEDLMNAATQTADLKEEFGKILSPYQTIKTVTVDEYNAILRKHFRAQNSYQYLYAPPLAFRYDMMFWYGAVAIVSLFGLRRIFTKTFENDRVRWIRKVAYPPLMILEAMTAAIAYYAVLHVSYLVEKIAVATRLTEAPVAISNYFYSGLWVATALTVFQIFFSALPRKLMVMDNDLVIKSLSYFSKKIPLSDIESVDLVRLNPFRLSLWWQVKHRLAFFNPRFWQRGLLIRLRNGKAYVFSVSKPLKAQSELRGFLTQPSEAVLTTSSTNASLGDSVTHSAS